MLNLSGGDARRGKLFLVLSAICYSTAGLFVQLIDTSVWTMLCVRGIVAAAFVFGLMLVQEGRDAFGQFSVLRSPPGALAITASALAMFFNLSAYQTTSVANVVVIYSTSPFVAAGFAWLIFGERVRRHTLIAAGTALVGTLILIGGSLGTGNLKGDFYAICMTFFMALMIVAVRWGKAHSMVAVACVSALASSLATLPFADFSTIGGRDLVLLVLFGITQLGLGLLFLTLGARHVNAGQSALIGTLDVPLAPLWVWIAFAAVPPIPTYIGGAVVMAAVFASIVWDNRDGAHAKEESV